MRLLIDIGNTRLKAALWDGRVLHALGATVHAGIVDDVDFDALWINVGRVDKVFVASVAGAALEQRLSVRLAEHFGIDAVFCTSPAAACGVRNAYAQPARFGIDRFLGLVALHARDPIASVLVGCGTALTLDALAADGTHLGGLIAPSPALMLDALTGAAARLAPPREARVVEVADNTADAMESGAWLAATALIERFVATVTIRLGVEPGLTLTGGAADRLGGLLARAARVESDLALQGLAIYADTIS